MNQANKVPSLEVHLTIQLQNLSWQLTAKTKSPNSHQLQQAGI
jgi:hypothetical protein